ncbi:ABC transporter ATP-binding protein [Jiangella endophytica]|uniref:ABC transporter ATP-binding protein n=1 Tax=Jiangella endophytica TaxID=1623398 RepID=UPI001E517391|nr:ABC transporter ATP-binding protein [Jiangella endophytica]
MEDLVVVLPSGAGVGTVLDKVSFEVDAGRTTGLIGESGSGKTMSAMSIVGLLPPGAEATGRITWKSDDLLAASARRIRQIRGHEIGVIFQDPLAALNPIQTIGKQVGEILRRGGMPRQQVRARVLELLERVGIPDPEQRIDVYPHEMSGGMRQRVMIATALAGEPQLIIADEPTTALDVTTQARILQLLADLRDQEGVAMLLVSHDLRVMAHVADDIVVMYAGRVAERGPAREVLEKPRHPYTRALANNVPAVSTKSAIAEPLRGAPANPFDRPAGCAFHPRCPMAQDRCRTEVPVLREVEPGRFSACHFAEGVES